MTKKGENLYNFVFKSYSLVVKKMQEIKREGKKTLVLSDAKAA